MEKGLEQMKEVIDFTKDSEYIRLFNRESANEREN